MADKRKIERFDGWTGGLFAGTNPDGAEKVHLLQADNVVINEDGSVEHRPGMYSTVNDVLATLITAIGEGPPGFSTFYATTEKEIYDSAYAASIHSYVNGGRGQFCYFAGKMAHSNGLDAMQAWTFGAAATANALGAPLSRILHIHNNRVFCALGQTLYETAPGTGPSDAVDNFAGGATWAINPSDGDPIVALASIGRDLYIFKSKSIWVQTGFTVNERQTRIFDSNNGCSSPDSPRTVNIRGIGECIVFLSTALKLCVIAGGSVQNIGDTVQSILDTIATGDTTATVPANVGLHRCCSAVHADGYYLLGFAPATGNLPTQFTRCLVLHLERPYASRSGTRWAFSLWYNTAEAGTFPVSFGAMCRAYNCFGVKDGVLIGQSDSLGDSRAMIMGSRTLGRTSDFTFKLPATSTYYSIGATIQTYHENGRDETLYKNWVEAVVRASRQGTGGAGTIDMTLTQTVEFDSVVITAAAISQVVTTANKVYLMTTDLTNDARRCSVTLNSITPASGSSGQGIKIHGLELYHTRGANA